MSTAELTQWNSEEALAEAMIPIIGGLHRKHSVTILLHSRSLVNKSVIKILRTHRFARQIRGDELSVEETFPFLEALTDLDLRPSKIDLGLLVTAYHAHGAGVPIPSSSRRASPTWSVAHRRAPRGRRTSSSTASAVSAVSWRVCSSRRPVRATA